MCLLSGYTRQQRLLGELLNGVIIINDLICNLSRTDHDQADVLPLLESNEVARVSYIMQIFSTASISQRKQVAAAMMYMALQFARYGLDSVKDRLMRVHCLLPSLTCFCDEDSLLADTMYLTEDISETAYLLCEGSLTRAIALEKAGWADLLVRSFLARPDDVKSLCLVSKTIHFLLTENSFVWKASFIAAGAEAVIENALKKEPFDLTSRYNEILFMLR
mmetsp:Transcript_13525/g.18525  ORF Transcript_13525/g.18525 Transcript_13525/m.18525 type:complete len:220 (-) Transcript_13525:91-750(-)